MAPAKPLKNALFWSASNQIVNKALSLISTMVVFRILSIHDVGVYTASFVLVSMINMINDLGLVAAINRWQGRLKDATQSAVTLVVAFSALLITILYLLAPFFAELFREPQVTKLVRILLLTTVIDAISSVPLAILLREIRQKRIALIEFFSTILQIAITIVLAKRGFGAMSLVIGMVISNAFSAICIITPYLEFLRPGFNKVIAKELVSFGSKTAGANVLSQFALNIDTILIGRNIGTQSLGKYQAAFNAGSLPSNTITSFLQRVTFSSLSRIQSQKERFNKMAYSYISVAIAAALLSAALLSGLSKQYITVVYGDKWIVAAPILTILAILGAYRVIHAIFIDIFAARGFPQYELILSGIWLAALIPTIYFATHISLEAVAWTHVLVSLCILAPVVIFFMRRIELELSRITKIFLFLSFASVPSYIISYSASHLISNKYVSLLTGGTLGIAAFLLITFSFLNKAFHNLEHSHSAEIDLEHYEKQPIESLDVTSPVAP